MIITKLEQINSTPYFFEIKKFFNLDKVFIKFEGLNVAGSIKLKTAISLLNNLENYEGINAKKNIIIESSSGNLGIALSIVCKSRGYQFICITDPNTLPLAEDYMRLYGAKIIKVKKKDKVGGYLGTRIDLIKQLVAQNKNLVWTNQYASLYNIEAHYQTTAKEIFKMFPKLDYLFIGAGTTGTLVGCAKYFKNHSPRTKIIAVDALGSVTFGFSPYPRYIPGIGTSRKPEIFSNKNIHDVILIDEKDTIFMCNYLLNKFGLFLGGSSGSIMHAVKEYSQKISSSSTVVALSPDFGEKYLQTVYNPQWVEEKFGVTIRERIFI